MAITRGGEFTARVATGAIAAGAFITSLFSNWPQTGPSGKIAYLREIRVICDYNAALNTGALATTDQNLADLAYNFYCKTAGINAAHGWMNLTGSQVQAVNYALTGKR